jgi:hypothetical protein
VWQRGFTNGLPHVTGLSRGAGGVKAVAAGHVFGALFEQDDFSSADRSGVGRCEAGVAAANDDHVEGAGSS